MAAHNYLGEVPIALEDSPFKDYTRADWALHYIERYGGIDGAHHKTWVLDQAARALKGCPIVDLRKATWTTGEVNYRFEQGESQEYLDWVLEMRGQYDVEAEEYEYDYDEGIPP